MKFLFQSRRHVKSAFTVIEVLVSSTLIVVIMGMLFSVVDNTQKLWQKTTSSITQFQSARVGFESMTRRLSQATLNTYWKAPVFDEMNAVKLPATFDANSIVRQSELQFLSGPAMNIFKGTPAITDLPSNPEKTLPGHAMFFQAPLGYTEETASNTLKFKQLDRTLMGCGYFVEFGADPTRPDFLNEGDMKLTTPSRERFRLMELNLPTEKLLLYERTGTTALSRLYTHILDANSFFYQAFVRENYSITNPWARPMWLKNAFTRLPQSKNETGRFQYARPMAENIIALIILPKISQGSAGTSTSTTDGSTTTQGTTVDAPYYAFDSWRTLKNVTSQSHLMAAHRDNLLPSIVQVTMVAIDEASAARMNASLADTGSIPNWMTDENDDPIFQQAKDYAKDLKSLEEKLQSMPGKINYRIFTMDVVIRGSKWSKPQDLAL